MTRLYHLEDVNVRTGKRERFTSYPMSQEGALKLRARFTEHPARYLVLVEEKGEPLTT